MFIALDTNIGAIQSVSKCFYQVHFHNWWCQVGNMKSSSDSHFCFPRVGLWLTTTKRVTNCDASCVVVIFINGCSNNCLTCWMYVFFVAQCRTAASFPQRQEQRINYFTKRAQTGFHGLNVCVARKKNSSIILSVSRGKAVWLCGGWKSLCWKRKSMLVLTF